MGEPPWVICGDTRSIYIYIYVYRYIDICVFLTERRGTRLKSTNYQNMGSLITPSLPRNGEIFGACRLTVLRIPSHKPATNITCNPMCCHPEKHKYSGTHTEAMIVFTLWTTATATTAEAGATARPIDHYFGAAMVTHHDGCRCSTYSSSTLSLKEYISSE